MSLNDVSKRYAKALFAASKEANTHAQTLASLTAIAEATTSSYVANFFQDPQVEGSKKVEAVSNTMELIKTPENVKNFVTLLMTRKRAAGLPEIAKAYAFRRKPSPAAKSRPWLFVRIRRRDRTRTQHRGTRFRFDPRMDVESVMIESRFVSSRSYRVRVPLH